MSRREWIALGAGTLVLAGIAFGMPGLKRVYWAEIQATLIAAKGSGEGCTWSDVRRALRVGLATRLRMREYAAKSVLLEADPAGLQHWRTPKGDYWAATSDAEVVTFLIAEEEKGIYSSGGHGVKPGDTVFDCGANIGVYTRTALEAGAKKVIAIEPEPRTLECLRRNLSKEAVQGRVVIVGKGVWDKEDTLEMQVDSANPSAHSFVRERDSGRHKLRLPLTTIDKLVAEFGLERVDFIKMDIEGAERNALTGARETIRRFHPRLAISVYHLADDREVIEQRVREAWPGYRRFLGSCTADREQALPEVFFYE